MASFQITLTPSRRAAARFVANVHRAINETFVARRAVGLRQSHIPKALGVHRSVINRELRGAKDMTLSRVGELAWAMGKEAVITFEEPRAAPYANRPLIQGPTFTVERKATASQVAMPQRGTNTYVARAA